MNILQPYFIREEIIKTTRKFFYDQNFHEIISPVLNTALPAEPNIYPFVTQWNTFAEKRNLYLPASPERGAKIMLGNGIGNSFAIGKSFRNLEGAGSQHIPEFIMLEWYRKNETYRKIMEDAQELIIKMKKAIDIMLHREVNSQLTYQGETIDLTETWEVFSYVELFKKYANLHLDEILDREKLFSKAKQKGYSLKDASQTSLLDQILVNEIEPHLPKKPFFMIDFLSKTSPMCALKKDQPEVCERFELYMFGMEVANGNTENIDAAFVKERFTKETEYRVQNNLLTSPVDIELVDALQKIADSGDTYAGIGVGIERLAMIMADTTLITDVELVHP